jgi:hypothetical protein
MIELSIAHAEIEKQTRSEMVNRQADNPGSNRSSLRAEIKTPP